MSKQLKEVRIEITNKCNTNCVMCPREHMKTPFGIITDELYREIVDECIELNIPTLVLCGYGEIFVDPDIRQKLEYLKNKKPEQHVSLTSNGYYITDEMSDFLAEATWIDTVRISISGFHPDTYKRIMKMKRDRIYDNVVNLHRKIREKGSNTKVKVNAVYIEDIYKEGEIEEYIQFWEEHSDWLEVWRPHNWTDFYDYRNLDKSELQTCGRPEFGPAELMWNGNYKICCFDSDGREVIGNYRQHSIKDFWELPRLKELQRLHAEKEFQQIPVCSKCDQVCANKTDALFYTSTGLDHAERLKMTGDLSVIKA